MICDTLDLSKFKTEVNLLYLVLTPLEYSPESRPLRNLVDDLRCARVRLALRPEFLRAGARYLVLMDFSICFGHDCLESTKFSAIADHHNLQLNEIADCWCKNKIQLLVLSRQYGTRVNLRALFRAEGVTG